MNTIPAVLAGRCANGNERGKGAVVHAVFAATTEDVQNAYLALCGVKHGPRSAGWAARPASAITCPTCQQKAQVAASLKNYLIRVRGSA